MWNWIRQNTRRHRRARGFGGSVAAVERLENRDLLTATLSKIALGAVTILPTVNGRQLLAAQNGTDTDLYTTDGTSAGTIRYGTIPGRITADTWANSEFTDFAVVGQNLYFNAWVFDGTTRHSIWKTDGTSAVKLLEQTITGSLQASGFTEFGGEVYFAATDGTSGRELWKSNGITTTLAVDVTPGSAGSNPRQLRTFDGQLYFTAGATETVYRTNGTLAGTVSVIDGDTQWSPLSADVGTVALVVADSRLILKRETVAGGIDLLAVTSATSAPTIIQHWTPAASASFVVDEFTVLGNNACFRRGDTSSGRFKGELWKTNGTIAGTGVVSSDTLFDAPVNKFGLAFSAIGFHRGIYHDNTGDTLVFFADAQSTWGLWQTDGSTLKQIPVTTPLAKPTGQRALITMDGRMYGIVPGQGIFEITSQPSLSGPTFSGRLVNGFAAQIDGNPGQLTALPGSAWFVTAGALWKVESAIADAVPGPSPVAGLSLPGALGTSKTNIGTDQFVISWNPVPGATGYRVNGIDQGSATSVAIPYVNDGATTLRVQAILPFGQFSQVSDFSFNGFLNSTNLSYVGPTAFTQSVKLQRDTGTNWLYRAEFVDPVSGKLLQTSSFRWTSAANGKQEAILPFAASSIPAHGRLTVQVSPQTVTAPINASSVTFDLAYSEISFSFNGATTTLSWPSVAGPSGYDLWVNDETRGISQYIRNQSLMTSTFTHTFSTGTYRIWVRSKDLPATSWSQPELLTVGEVPRLLAPSGTFNSPDWVTRFQWPKIKGATGFELWVNQVGGTSKIIHETALPESSTSFRPTTPLPHGRYQAWIRSQGTGPGHGVWSAPINFTILPYPVTPVVVTTPFAARQTISWTAPFAGIKYELWIGKPDGTQVFRQSNINATSFVLPNTLPVGEYRVSLRGQTADGLMLPWSNQDKVPLLIGLKGFVIPGTAGNRTLLWNSVPDATHYDVWVNYESGSQPAQSQIYRNTSVSGTTLLLPGTLPAGNYRVWIRAIRIEAGVTFATSWTPNGMSFSLT